MKRLTARIISLSSMLIAAPLLAQNGVQPAAPPPTTSTPLPPPSTGTTPLPPGPVTPTPEVNPAPASNTVSAVPVTTAPPPPPEPVTINPDAAYPNGFADPVDPFGNLAQPPQQSGFPWGLLGLLGLLGLIPLVRRGGGRTTRTVYVDRDDPKRVLREEQTDD